MRPLRFVQLVAAPVLTAFVFACSAAPLSKGNTVQDDDDDDDRTEENLSQPRTPTYDASPPPPPPVVDAGADAAEGSVATNAQACAQLSACCGQLADYYDRLACIGVALADDIDVCQPALVVCQGGGVGIGGYFDETSGGACSDLAGCCRQMQQRSDPSAYACEKWVTYGDENECYLTHQDYRYANRCR